MEILILDLAVILSTLETVPISDSTLTIPELPGDTAFGTLGHTHLVKKSKNEKRLFSMSLNNSFSLTDLINGFTLPSHP